MSQSPGESTGRPLLHLRHKQLLTRTEPLLRARLLRPSDLAVLDAVATLWSIAEHPRVALAMALSLAAPRHGHVGVDLLRARQQLQAQLSRRTSETQLSHDAALDCVPTATGEWLKSVRQHPAVTELGADPNAPFVWQQIDHGASSSALLLTQRMWREQQRLADALDALATAAPSWIPPRPQLDAMLDEVYGAAQPANHEQRAAASLVANSCLSVITGGPGTGKTWGIKRILLILSRAAQTTGRELVIALAAPTGKAAVRMAEVLRDVADLAGVTAEVATALDRLQPRTLHRLLGVLPHQPHRFQHGRHNKLRADVVVVDEASMVDLAMMRHLVEAIEPGARLVLLGDRDQLASVDAGTVLADIVSTADARAARPTGVAASVRRLTVSYRFAQAASIACVAQALQSRDPALIDESVALMCQAAPSRPLWRQRLEADPGDDPERPQRISWLRQAHRRQEDGPAGSKHTQPLDDSVIRALFTPYISDSVHNLRHRREAPTSLLDPQPGYLALLQQRLRAPADGALHEPSWHVQLLDALSRYRVLAAHRKGERGVDGLNKTFSELARAQLSSAARTGRRSNALLHAGAHWLGQPVIITRNSYEVDLRNGDVGLVLPQLGSDGRMRLVAAFSIAATGAPASTPRYVGLSRLPEHGTALAMSVHKSQGSQFERVALVLPAQADAPIMTRELVYTAITRAMWRVDWVGETSVLRAALRRGVQRASGLAQRLTAG